MDYLLDPGIHALMGSMSGGNCWVCTLTGVKLTHWPRVVVVISKVLSLNLCYGLSLWELVKLPTYIYRVSYISSIVVRNHVSQGIRFKFNSWKKSCVTFDSNRTSIWLDDNFLWGQQQNCCQYDNISLSPCIGIKTSHLNEMVDDL